MYAYWNNTLQRVEKIGHDGGLSETTLIFAVLAGIVIGICVTYFILKGIAYLLGLKK